MYILGIDSFTKQVFDILRSLLFTISSFFCDVIIYVYDIFIRLSKAQFLTSSQVQDIYSRVTLILGIFMLFKLMISFIQYLINPELMNDKSKGASKLIVKSIVVIAVLGITPFAFQQAYKLQNLILDSNFLAKIIFSTDTDSNASEFGADLVSTLFLSMYSINDGESCDNIGNDVSLIEEEIKYNHSYTLARDCLNVAASGGGLRHTYEEGYVVNFQWNGLGLVVVSGITAYIILSYCLSIGMRVIQLAFLQLISPIPIMSYLGEDKDGAFSKWLKRCLSTFLDLFIRLGIIYFVVYIIGLLIGNDSSSYYLLLSTTGNPTGFLKTLILLVLIIGLLMFAKKAPDLLKELLPQGIGNNIGFGISTPSKFMRDNPMVARAYGAARVGVGVASGNFRRGIGKVIDAAQDGDAKGAFKWAGRAAISTFTGAFSGANLGARTTDASGRRNAISTGRTRTSSKYKVRDAGYGGSVFSLATKSGREGLANYWKDVPRRVFMQDSVLDQKTEGLEYGISSLQQQIYQEQQDFVTAHHRQMLNIQKNKTGSGYVVVDEKGNISATYNTSAAAIAAGVDAAEIRVADLTNQLGKMKSASKALNQKSNEQNNKK